MPTNAEGHLGEWILCAENMMKRKNANTLGTTIHIVGWLLIFGFPFLMMGRGGFSSVSWNSYLINLCAPLVFGIVFYSNYTFLVPRFFFKKGRRQYFFYNICLIVVVAFLLHFCSEWLRMIARPMYSVPSHVDFPSMEMVPPPRWTFIVRDMVMLCFMAGLATAIRLSQAWGQIETARREAETARTEAELKNLRNQLSPHFLLNTLNNIYALIAFDSEKAQLAVMELSKLLRHMLYENQTGNVSLQSEADFIKNYVELMRLRLTKEVKVTMDIQIPADSKAKVAPLIFISLIENAFKHGVSHTSPSFVSILLKEEIDGSIYCSIANSNHPKTLVDKSGSGIGLDLVKQRLQMIYPNQYEWICGLNSDGSIYTSTLIIRELHKHEKRQKKRTNENQLCINR